VGVTVLAVISSAPDVDAFVAGFQAVLYVAIAVLVAFIGINFIRKMFGI
jgi:hypothetical protein